MWSQVSRRRALGLAVGVVVGAAAAGEPLAAQSADVAAVTVGDGTVDGSFIRSYASAFRLWKMGDNGEREPFGRWTDSVRYVEHQGRRTLYRAVARYTAEDVKDLWRDHLVDPETLAPFRTLQHFGDGLGSSVLLEFAGDSLTVEVKNGPDAPVQTVGRSYETPVYDLSLYAILLVGFPLEEGFTAQFPTFGNQLVPVSETMRVTGRERVPVEDGRTVEAWVVETEYRPWTVWLTREPPYIAKVVQRMPDGSVIVSERTWVSVPDRRGGSDR